MSLFDQYLTKINAMMKDFRLNTVLSEAMIFVNSLSSSKTINKTVLERLVVTLSPAFPFISEELWAELGHKESVFLTHWPKSFGTANAVPKVKILIDQKFIDEIDIDENMTEEELLKLIKDMPQFSQKLDGHEIKRTIYKKGELLNIITRG